MKQFRLFVVAAAIVAVGLGTAAAQGNSGGNSARSGSNSGKSGPAKVSTPNTAGQSASRGGAKKSGPSGAATGNGGPTTGANTTAATGPNVPATTATANAGGTNASNAGGANVGGSTTNGSNVNGSNNRGPGSSTSGSNTGGSNASGSNASGSNTSGSNVSGPNAGSPNVPAAGSNNIAAKISRNPNQVARLQPLLPQGMTLDQAAAGFRNQGQFIAALNASKHRGIAFADLKNAMTHDGLSLGQAVRKLQPPTTSGATPSSNTSSTN